MSNVLSDNLRRDLIFAFRLFAKAPGFTSVAVLSLSVSIGANTAIFGLINAVVLRPLAVPAPHEIVQIGSTDRGNRFIPLSYAQQKDLEGRQTTLSSMAGWFIPVLNVEAETIPSRSAVLAITRDYYRTFPVRPVLGRLLQPSDWSSSGDVAAVTMISSEYWEERFRHDPHVIGKLVRVEGRVFTIVGVLPKGFSSPQIDITPVLTIPVETNPLRRRQNGAFDAFGTFLFCSGRLRHGISQEQASAELQTVWPEVLRGTEPPTLDAAEAATFLTRRLQVDSGARGQSFLRSRFSSSLSILMAAVAMLLLLAAVNVATLLLARSSARANELSVRLALGASRGRLLQQLVTEGSLLGVVTTMLGILFALWFSRILLPFMWSSPVPLTISVRLDTSVLAFSALVGGGVTLLFSLLPGWISIAESVNAKLRQSARSVAGSQGLRLRISLVTAQVALAFTLLCGAWLLIETAQRLRSVNLGFDPRAAAVLFLSPKPGGYSSIDSTSYSRELLRQVRSQPGVASAALSDLPISNSGDTVRLITQHSSTLAVALRISDGFFRTMGASNVSGRDFSLTDTPKSVPVAVLSRAAATRLFANEPAVGRSILVEDAGTKQTLNIVGVCENARFGDLHNPNQAAIYLPMFQNPKSLQYAVLDIRALGDVSGLIPAVSSRVQALNREYVFWSEEFEKAIDVNLGQERMLATLLSFFGSVALFLGLIGLYGVFAFTVSRRIREFGLRMALGASRADVFKSILGEAVLLVALGIGIGLPLAFAASKVLSTRIAGLDHTDPASFLPASMLLLCSSSAVASIPAFRAAHVDLAGALRVD